jgi:hypothetical protein
MFSSWSTAVDAVGTAAAYMRAYVSMAVHLCYDETGTDDGRYEIFQESECLLTTTTSYR